MTERRGHGGREHGDRSGFLAPARRGLAEVPPGAPPSPVPEARPRARDTDLGDDLLGAFVAGAREAGAEVVTTPGTTVPDAVLDRWCAAHTVRRAVRSEAREAHAVATVLATRGVDVAPATVEAASGADLGITSASALIAATGTLVLRSDVDGRLASLLPPVHLCVAPAHRLVPTAGAVLRPLTREAPPAGLVLVTGTSRTGDIEQLLTRRVHGPGTVLVVVTDVAL